MHRARILLKLFLTVVAVAVATCGVTSALVNPYDIFRIFYHRSINGDKPVAINHERLRRAADIMRIRPRTVLLGSSAVRYGVEVMEVADLVPADARPIYNAGILNGGMVEILQYLKHAKINNPDLKLAIVGIEWNLFTGIKRPEPLDVPPVEALNHRWLPLNTILERTLTWTALYDSWRTIDANSGDQISSLLASIKSRLPVFLSRLFAWTAAAEQQQALAAAQPATAFTPTATKLHDDHPLIARSRQETVAIYFSYWMTSTLYGFKLNRPDLIAIERSYELMRDIVDFCKQSGIELHFYVSPQSSVFWTFVDRSGTWVAHLEWLRRIERISPFWNFQDLIDFSRDAHGWFPDDPLHYSQAAGRAIVSEILTHRAAPHSSAYYVSSDRIEERLRARTALLKAAEKTQSYVTDVAQLLPMTGGLDWPGTLPVRLLPQYNGFQIVRFGGRYYALPAWRSAYDVLDALRGQIPGGRVADTLAELLPKLANRPVEPSDEELDRQAMLSSNLRSVDVPADLASDWRPVGARLHRIDTPSGQPIFSLVESTRHSIQNVASRIRLTPGHPVKLAVRLKDGGNRRAIVMVFNGANRIACGFDPATGWTQTMTLNRAQDTACTALRLGTGWWRVELTGALDIDDNEPSYVTIALSQDGLSETYSGDGRSSIEIGAVSAWQSF